MARSERSRKNTRRLSWFRLFILLGLILLVTVAGVGTGFILGTLRGMPTVDVLNPPDARLTSFIYDKDGNLVTQLYNEQNRVPIDISEVPDHVIKAIVAIEDARFFEHFGIDLRGLLRAVYITYIKGSSIQGGSTITQQLARNLFPQVGTERTIRRKLQEAAVAIQLERKYTKREILEMYLNQVPFGHSAYGIVSASQIYFGKNVSDLTLAEAALLAGLPQAPSKWSPHVSMKAARDRQAAVLDRMVAAGYISSEEAEAAKKVPILTAEEAESLPKEGGQNRTTPEAIILAPLKSYGDYPAPHFVDYVLEQLLEHFRNQNLSESEVRDRVFGSGLKVYTTLDMNIQKAAQEAVAQVLDPVFPMKEGQRYPQAAVVVLDNKTGYIRAMVGGRSHQKMRELNRAWQAYRQPGSAFKPLAVYTPALAMGYSAASVWDDSPAVYDNWTPMNYDKKFRGLTTMREAVRRSINVVAVKAMDKIGIENGVDFARRLGIDSLDLDTTDDGLSDLNLPTALGGLTIGVTPLEMARAYGTLANGGVRVEPTAIIKVVDQNGEVLIDNTKPQKNQEVVVDEAVAYIMTDILRSVVEPQSPAGWLENWGTGSRARGGEIMSRWPIAGKTGTTSDVKDIWFVGYTPRLVGAVWMGYDNPPERIKDGAGGLWPAQIWNRTMTVAHKDLKPEEFPRPPGIVTATICIETGKLPGPDCPPSSQRNEIFVEGTQPREIGTAWKTVRVVRLPQDSFASNNDFLRRYPEFYLNPYVLWDAGCPTSLRPEVRTMLERPTIDYSVIEKAARIFYEDKFKASNVPPLIPLDVAHAVPRLTCSQALEATGWQPGAKIQDQARYTLELKDSAFQPAILEVYTDQKVELRLVNRDSIEHRFILPAFRVALAVPAGEATEVSFETRGPSLLPFYCDLHPGMQGRLLVKERSD